MRYITGLPLTANDTEVDIGAVVGDIRVGVVAARM